MDLSAADAPGLPTWIRLVVAIVAFTHAMLCARVVFGRAWRAVTERGPRVTERVPTAAMVAYGLVTGHVARITLIRLPDEPPLATATTLTYAAALVAGTIAFGQIVYLTRGERRAAASAGSSDRVSPRP